MVVKEPPKRMMGPSLETGTVFDAVLSVNYCANCDCVSVRAVQEKCDEKGPGAASGRRKVKIGSSAGPPSAIPLGFARGFGRLSRKAREGAHPRRFWPRGS